MKENTTVQTTKEVVPVESGNPAVVGFLSMVFVKPSAEGDGHDKIDSTTMLTPNQAEELREGFASLITKYCDAVDGNSTMLRQSLDRAASATTALRTAVGGDGHEVQRDTVQPATETRPPRQTTPEPATPTMRSLTVRLPREGSKARILVEFLYAEGRVTPERIHEWACSNKKMNSDGAEERVMTGRTTAMLRSLHDNGVIVEEEIGGENCWQLTKGAVTSFQYLDAFGDGQKPVKPECAKRSDGPKPGSKMATVLGIIAAAGPGGISTAEIKNRRPDRSCPKGTLRALLKGGHICNITSGGRGNPAGWTTTDKGRAETSVSVHEQSTSVDRPRPREGQSRRKSGVERVQASLRGEGDGNREGGGPHPALDFAIENDPQPRAKPPPKSGDKGGGGGPPSRSSVDDDDGTERKTRKAEWKPPPRANRGEQLPHDRPTPLPPKAMVTKDTPTPSEWDNLLMRLMKDWEWQLTFIQLITAAKEEGPSYGFSIDGWGRDRIEKELARSVGRLVEVGKLRIGDDRNTLFPTELTVCTTPTSPPANPQPPTQPQPDDDRPEIADEDDWELAVMKVIEDAVGSITEAAILEEVWRDTLAELRLPTGISAEDVEKNVGLAIVALEEEAMIARDSEADEGADEQSDGKEIRWKIT